MAGKGVLEQRGMKERMEEEALVNRNRTFRITQKEKG
jgi:hypothetical protein